MDVLNEMFCFEGTRELNDDENCGLFFVAAWNRETVFPFM